MRLSWTTAALLGALLAVGCGDRRPQESQNFEQNSGAATPEVGESGTPAAASPDVPSTGAPSVRADDSTAGTAARESGARATTGTATRAPAAPAPGASAAASPRRDPAPAPAARWREVTVPANTALPLELLTAVSSETAQVETPVRARLRQGVVVDGFTALPAGTVLSGHVIDVARAGRVQGRSRLALRFTEAEVNGIREDVRTNPITFEGEATRGEDATKVGAGAVGGAIVGGILGGGSGAAKGAAVGAAAGTGVVLATRGREVTLGAGTDLAATLASAITVRAETR